MDSVVVLVAVMLLKVMIRVNLNVINGVIIP
jgi:hypothetical protein